MDATTTTATATGSAGLTNPSKDVPRTIGDLVVVRRLGQGKVGEVFEARDQDSGLRCVMKRMLPDGNMIDSARFLREANLMTKLRHPNLMPVLHSDFAAHPAYYVMPLRDGETVADRLAREKKLGVGLAARIARDICSGLTAVHRLGIVHRDIKPQNLLLEVTGRTVIFDFGIAKVVKGDSLTALGTILGSPAYMSPEQCVGGNIDGHADVYSLGVTVYELLTGKNPFAAIDVIGTLRRQLGERPRRLDAVMPGIVPEEMGELVYRMLAKDPTHRPAAERCLETFAGLTRQHDRPSAAPAA